MTEESASDNEGIIARKKSRVRKEVEEAMAEAGLSLEPRISAVNLDTHEKHFFDTYPEAMEFIKGKKGRWYVTAPGVKYEGKSAKER